jgi:hypothetical protein
VRVTVVVCVGTEEGSCLRVAVDTAMVVGVVAAAAGNDAVAWHHSPWVTVVAYYLVLDYSSFLHPMKSLPGEGSPPQTIPKGH